MTEELREKILLAETLVTVEDLYRPYRPKRRTRATIAKEKGLEPLAAYMMLAAGKQIFLWKKTAKQVYIGRKRSPKDRGRSNRRSKRHYCGNHYPIMRIISTWIRKTTDEKRKSRFLAAKDPETESVYEMYYEFEESV